MYSAITSNKRRSTILIGLFIGVIAVAGYVFGMVTNTGSQGLVYAVVVSVGMSLFSWFAGDRIVLWTSGAQEIRSKEEQPYLWNMVENLCITAGLPMPRLYVISDPARNAFATGRDPAHASVAVTSGLLESLENEELQGVLAHELSHVKNFDTRIMILAAVLVGALTLLGDAFFRWSFFGRSRDNDRGNSGTLFAALGVLFLILSPLIGQLIQLAISREREYLADASASLLTRYPEGLARALEKIARSSTPVRSASAATAHLWIANPYGSGGRHQWIASLFSTHPPVDDRIARLRGLL